MSIDLNHVNEWQYRDEVSGLVFPWYTKPFLDELKTWDLKHKSVFEYGGGASTLWWRHYTKSVITVENNLAYFNKLKEYPETEEKFIMLRDDEKEYVEAMNHDDPAHFIIIDGAYREECIKRCAPHAESGQSILIIDNWEFAEHNREVREALQHVSITLFKQPNHSVWTTALVETNM